MKFHINPIKTLKKQKNPEKHIYFLKCIKMTKDIMVKRHHLEDEIINSVC